MITNIKKILKKNDLIFFILNRLFKYLRINKSIKTSNNYKIRNSDWKKNYLNGQKYRQIIIKNLLKKINFKLIIETGTEYGFTTIFFSKFKKKVFTIEKSKIIFQETYKRLKNYKNIILKLSDSKNLKKLIKLNFKKLKPTDSIFFYLDAHADDDYPLEEEIKFITKNYNNFLILIDDFEVPHDDGYGYDSCNGRKINLKFLKNVLNNKIFLYFPKTSSKKETGRKRGYILMTKNQKFKKILDNEKLLLNYPN